MQPFYQDSFITLFCGDVIERLRELPSESVHCVVTSPPYYALRDYGTAAWEGGDDECDHRHPLGGEGSSSAKQNTSAGTQTIAYRDICGKCGAIRIDSQIGLEPTLADFLAKMVEVFEEVKRVLRGDGVFWLNIGDSYNGSGKGGNPDGSQHTKQTTNAGSLLNRPTHLSDFKPKDLMLVPHRLAIALQDAGWWVRDAMPWVKRSCMPGSQTDRATNALEYIFMLTKRAHYFTDFDAVRVGSSWDASKTKFPDGWDTTVGNGNHGSFNKEGRSKGKQNDAIPPQNWKNSSFSKGKTAGHQLDRSQSDESRANRDRSLPTNRNGITGSLDETPAGSRTFRNSDLWFSSIGTPHGVVGVGDEIVGLDVNPAGFSAEFCTACGQYFDGAGKKAIKAVGDKRVCPCGRSDSWLSHFATFPGKLIEPLIKIGTSEHGVCADCGSQYVRVTEKAFTDHTGSSQTAYADGMAANRMALLRQAARENGSEYVNKIKTTGWAKSCKCLTDERIPATVLDPFAGASTSLIVAKQLGRRAIGIDLSKDYLRMSIERIKAETSLALFDRVGI